MATLERGIYDVVVDAPLEPGDMFVAAGTINTSGNNTVVGAPGARNRIVVVALQVQNESAVATTVQAIFDATQKWRALLQTQGQLVQAQIPGGWILPQNDAFVLNLSGANSIGYSISYYIESV